MKYFVLYYCIGNVLTFLLYGMDKRKAKRNKYRISESTLIGLACMGGCYGAWLGMSFFHHKTKHVKFKILVPLAMIVHTGGLLWILY